MHGGGKRVHLLLGDGLVPALQEVARNVLEERPEGGVLDDGNGLEDDQFPVAVAVHAVTLSENSVFLYPNNTTLIV